MSGLPTVWTPTGALPTKFMRELNENLTKFPAMESLPLDEARKYNTVHNNISAAERRLNYCKTFYSCTNISLSKATVDSLIERLGSVPLFW